MSHSFGIVFEDANVIVLNKPAGLLSQGDHSGEASLVEELQEYLGRPYVGLVHRLDRETTGLMVVAKRTKAARRLTEDLQEGRIYRDYLALLQGEVEGEHRWEDWLLKEKNVVRTAPPKTEGSKHAALNMRVVGQVNDQTLVHLVLETGRSHQIRVQCASRGLPLVGDTKYGGPASTGLHLHSYRLAFRHPLGERETMGYILEPQWDARKLAPLSQWEPPPHGL